MYLVREFLMRGGKILNGNRENRHSQVVICYFKMTVLSEIDLIYS